MRSITSTTRRGFSREWIASIIVLLVIWVGYTIIQGNQANFELEQAKLAVTRLETLIEQLSTQPNGVGSGGGGSGSKMVHNTDASADASASTSLKLPVQSVHSDQVSLPPVLINDVARSNLKVVDSPPLTLGVRMRQQQQQQASHRQTADNAVVRITDKSPDKKCNFKKMNEYISQRAEQLKILQIPFKLVDPKSKDENVSRTRVYVLLLFGLLYIRVFLFIGRGGVPTPLFSIIIVVNCCCFPKKKQKKRLCK